MERLCFADGNFGVVGQRYTSAHWWPYYKRLLPTCCIISFARIEYPMDRNVSESPLLIAQNGPLKGQRWTINKPLLVGRETTCEIMIPDRMVSRFHARISPT